MKVCVISPASHLDQFSVLGDCEMALTHLIAPNAGFDHSEWVNKNYIPYFKQRSSEGKWVILDNSAYEIGKLEAQKATGEGLGPNLVLEAAEIIKPSIVIAQDVLCDREATLESTKDFIRHVKKREYLGNFKIMAVAQGNTEDEWLESYKELMELEEIDQIGLSKISVPLSFGGNQAEDGCVAKARLEASKRIHEEFYKDYKEYKVEAHLLGGDNYLPWELKQQTQYDWIFSNDSSATVWYGAQGQEFDPITGKIEHIITNKPDLENNEDTTADLLTTHYSSIVKNISVLHSFSKG